MDPHLSVSKMYLLYTEECQKKGIPPVKLHMYRSIFNTEFNLGFHVPKTDMCDFCEKFRTSSEEEKIALQDEYNLHQHKKNLARENKAADKERSTTDNKLCVACFVLQQVLNCPKGEVSNFYYKRKLSAYNFTVYDLNTKDAFCYMWTKADAKRGSCDIPIELFYPKLGC